MARRRSSYYGDYWPQFEPTIPIDVENGLKAKSRRGKFVSNWWADRWIAALRPLMDSGRLSRGRSYARRGQVIDMSVTPGSVSARVQGSRQTPYKVSIELQPLNDAQWEEVLDALSGQAIFAAKLLNGEMPADIDQVFDAVDVPLFPESEGDLDTDCSCPDWANPCKHIAAVYYLLGERFDEDPFLLLELRGRTQEAITAALRDRRAEQEETVEGSARAPGGDCLIDTPALDECVDRYWSMGSQAENMVFRIEAPDVEMALLKRLGIPGLDGMVARNFQAQMARVYGAVARRAMDIGFADAMAQAEGDDAT